MYGWRARIGLILPADNVLMEPELNALQLPGVSFHGLRLTATDHDSMRRQAVDLGGAITELGLDAATYACAETSFNAGSGIRRTLSELIAGESGVPLVTATNAMFHALSRLGADRVAVVTPYKSASARVFEETIEEQGVRVVSAVHRDFSEESDDAREWFRTNRQPPSEVYQMARSAYRPDAQAIVIAATNLPTLDVLASIEADLGVPVLTSNQCILWWCLQAAGVTTSGIPLGRLMELPLGTAERSPA